MFRGHALVRVGPKQTVLTPFRDGIRKRRQVSVGDRGVLPTRSTQKPLGIGSQDAYTVLLLICARIAIAVGILWCYVYDARPITNGSLL